MRKKQFTPEEIIGKLRHADVLLGQGKKRAEFVGMLLACASKSAKLVSSGLGSPRHEVEIAIPPGGEEKTSPSCRLRRNVDHNLQTLAFRDFPQRRSCRPLSVPHLGAGAP